MENSNLNWFVVDTESMSTDLKKKWQALKKAQETVKAAKDDFESGFVAAAKKAERIDDNVSLMFSYRFGKLSVAKATEAAKPKAPPKPKFSF